MCRFVTLTHKGLKSQCYLISFIFFFIAKLSITIIKLLLTTFKTFIISLESFIFLAHIQYNTITRRLKPDDTPKSIEQRSSSWDMCHNPEHLHLLVVCRFFYFSAFLPSGCDVEVSSSIGSSALSLDIMIPSSHGSRFSFQTFSLSFSFSFLCAVLKGRSFGC